jgi:hypothetical protein
MADTDDELDPVIVAGANRAFTDNGRKLAVGAGVIIVYPHGCHRWRI